MKGAPVVDNNESLHEPNDEDQEPKVPSHDEQNQVKPNSPAASKPPYRKSSVFDQLFPQGFTPYHSQLLISAVIGCFVGGVLAYLVFNAHNSYRSKLKTAQVSITQQQETIKQLERKLEDQEMDLNNLSKGYAQISKILTESKMAPKKPIIKKLRRGVLIYWVDEVLWRHYYVYRGKGPSGKMFKINKKSQKLNFIYLKSKPRGYWRFAISAVDQEGNETEMSNAVVLK